MFNNQIVGLIRFSYPSKGGFVHKLEDTTSIEKMLYDPARLERRFELFENLCLPSLLEQTDPDFTCVVLIGKTLPDWAKSRLLDGLDKLAGGVLVQDITRHHYGAIKRAFNTVSHDGYTHRTTFRLDDDDALDLGFIKRLRKTARKLKPLHSENTPLIMAFNRGFYLRKNTDGTQEIFDAYETTPLSVGTAMLAMAGENQNVYARNHRFLPRFFNTWSDATTPAYLRAIHQDNDSDPFIHGRKATIPTDEVHAMIRKGFPLKTQKYLGIS